MSPLELTMKSLQSSRFLLLGTLLVSASMLLSTPALAQRDAVIAGRVADLEGNPVPNATVTVYSPDRGETRTFQTDGDGNYMGRGFRTDTFIVTVEAEGFAPQQREVKLNFGMNTVDASLEVGATAPDIDYEMVNSAYADGFAAYERAITSGAAEDWEAAASAMQPVVDELIGQPGEDVAAMRLSALEVLGRSQLERGLNAEAIATYTVLIESDADSVEGHSWKAQAHVRSGDYESAVPHVRRAAELAPDDATNQYNKGAILLQVGEVEEGIAAMERSVELRPDFPLALKQLGYGYLRLGAQDTAYYEKAIAMLRQYVELVPDAPDRADVEGMIGALEAQIQD